LGDENFVTEEGLFEIKTKEDAPIDKGKYLVLWKKEDGKWKLHRDISNSDLPAATK
jgi:ketosteroid isomerase-like protein